MEKMYDKNFVVSSFIEYFHFEREKIFFSNVRKEIWDIYIRILFIILESWNITNIEIFRTSITLITVTVHFQ